jgi:hypothetical protein
MDVAPPTAANMGSNLKDTTAAPTKVRLVTISIDV